MSEEERRERGEREERESGNTPTQKMLWGSLLPDYVDKGIIKDGEQPKTVSSLGI